MDSVKRLLYGPPRLEKKYIRKSQGQQPYYLKALPFHQKYPRTIIFGGGFLAFFITFSGCFYHMLFTNVEDLSPEDMLWPKERETGVTYAERIRMAYPKPEK